jgi:hypothetical protein
MKEMSRFGSRESNFNPGRAKYGKSNKSGPRTVLVGFNTSHGPVDRKLERVEKLEKGVTFQQNQQKNQTKSETTYSTTWDQQEMIEIDLDEIRARLDRLRTLAHVETRRLSGLALDDYRTLVRYTQLLFDTDAYQTYHDEVVQRFGDLKNGDIVAGTVAGYFAGCLAKTSSPDPSFQPACSIICAGQMPLPQKDDEPFCPSTVMMAIRNKEGYEFKTIYNGSPNNDLLIYIDSKSGPFTGFNEQEKKILEEHGATKIRIYRYEKDGKTYTNITNGSAQLNELPSRADVLDNIDNENPVQRSNTGLMIVLLIFLILVIIFIGWRIWASDKEGR